MSGMANERKSPVESRAAEPGRPIDEPVATDSADHTGQGAFLFDFVLDDIGDLPAAAEGADARAAATAPAQVSAPSDTAADEAAEARASAAPADEPPVLLDPSADGEMRSWTRGDMEQANVPTGGAIAVRLREILAMSHAFERRLGATLDVNATDLSAMEHLINEGPLTPSDLAKRLGVTTAASTLVADRLVALGHVERRPHPRDRRKIIIVPAHASVARAVDELMPVAVGVSGLVSALSEAERAVVEQFLGGVVGVYRDAVTAPALP